MRTAYKQNPRSYNYAGIDDGSQCKSKYGQVARASNKRSTPWIDYYKANVKQGKGPGQMARLAAEWRAKQAKECKD